MVCCASKQTLTEEMISKFISRAEKPIPWLALALIIVANFLIFLYVPNERLMGPVQRIFYFHVAAAITCYVSIAFGFVAAVIYLRSRSRLADAALEACGEVGFLFCTIVMCSGMIWAKSAWNAFFTWEPRLVTFLLLWLIFLALNTLRAFGEPAKLGAHSAVLMILAAVTVPLVIVSVKLLPQTGQLHPQVMANRGLLHPSFKQAMILSTLGWLLFQIWLVWLRTRLALVRQELANMESKA